MKVTMELDRTKAERMLAMAMNVSKKVTMAMSDKELAEKSLRLLLASHAFCNFKIIDDDSDDAKR